MRRLILAAAFLAALPAAASAQFQVGVGAAIPTGDLADAYDTGLHFQGSFNIGLPVLPDIRIDGIYQKFDNDASNTNVLGGGVNLLLDLPLVVIKPYLLAGAGYYDVSTEADDGTGGEIDVSDGALGLTGGAGLRVALGRLGVFGEVRVLKITGDADITDIPVIVGVTF